MGMVRFIHFVQILTLFMIFNTKAQSDDVTFRTPDEGRRHTATWMAYGATLAAWGSKSIYSPSRLIARKDLIRIAATIAKFEPVKMIINENDLNEAKQYLTEIKKEVINVYRAGYLLPNITASGDIQFIKYPVNDLWTRDTSAIFVFDENKNPYGVNFNFNGWGQRNTGAPGWKRCPIKSSNRIPVQRILEDQNIADFIIQYTGVKKIRTWLVMEGGGIEVNGKGTAICTESCILNNNRNPGKTKEDVEKELLRVLGIKKVIWLPGIKGKEITDGHVDFYARFVSETKVVYSLERYKLAPEYNTTNINEQILHNATDALGNKLIIIPLTYPDQNKVEIAFNLRNGLQNNKTFFNNKTFAGGYVGFYLANNCVIMSKFGDEKADKAALDTLNCIFPDRFVIQITTDGIANGGGTIHCATQQQIFL